MNTKYIQYLEGLNISEVNTLLEKMKSNMIELESKVLKYGVYTLKTFEKEQKLQEILNENIENYNVTNEELSLIQSKVIKGIADSEDYKKIDYFLSAVNLGGYILNNMKERGYMSYQNFIDQKESNGLYKGDRFNEAFIEGIIVECIKELKNYLNN